MAPDPFRSVIAFALDGSPDPPPADPPDADDRPSDDPHAPDIGGSD